MVLGFHEVGTKSLLNMLGFPILNHCLTCVSWPSLRLDPLVWMSGPPMCIWGPLRWVWYLLMCLIVFSYAGAPLRMLWYLLRWAYHLLITPKWSSGPECGVHKPKGHLGFHMVLSGESQIQVRLFKRPSSTWFGCGVNLRDGPMASSVESGFSWAEPVFFR